MNVQYNNINGINYALGKQSTLGFNASLPNPLV
jgi:hypothetical protein